jgi:hypothetical protein
MSSGKHSDAVAASQLGPPDSNPWSTLIMKNLLGRKGARALAATLLAVVAGAGAAPISRVSNGDFETGTYAGWTKSGTTVYLGSNLYTGLGGLYGTTTVGFGAGGSYSGLLSQVIGTRVGSTYQLSFDYGWFAGCNCGDGAQSLRAEINGVTLATVVDNSPSYSTATSMSHFSYSFVASSATTTLAFRDLTVNGGSSDGLFDNVVVTGDAPIPEPGSFALAGLALACLGWSRRKAV